MSLQGKVTGGSQALQVIVQKLKKQQEHPEGQDPRNLPLPLKYLHASAHPCTLVELVELAAKFHQKRSESIARWLLCLWDTGADGIILSGDELILMSSVSPTLPCSNAYMGQYNMQKMIHY